MSSTSTVSYNDIKRKGSDFSFTKKLSDYARNDKWVESYKDSIGDDSNDSSLSTMWRTVRIGSEEVGNAIYTKIKNFIDEIGNIDTCTVNQLRRYADILGVDNDYLNINFSFPSEIAELIDIFSVNRAYLYNKAISNDDQSVVLKNTIIGDDTSSLISKLIKNDNDFKTLVQKSVYNTIMNFLNLKNVTFDSSKDGIETIEIWKTDISRFSNKLWNDEIESDSSIYSLKSTLGVDKSFTEKIYANDIIEGTRKLSDFTDVEQIVINAEIENRKTRYSDSHSMQYYYVRLYKVIEYFRFVLTVYTSVYMLEDYDIDETKFIIGKDTNINLIRSINGSYEIDTDIVSNISIWIANYIISISRLRTDMRSQCRRNAMAGTKRLIIDTIRKFIIDSIDNSKWLNISGNILRNAGLNTNFNVNVVEYVDTTDYTNIETESDISTPSDYTTHPRFWENYDDVGNAIENETIRKFFNRLHDDGVKFKSNEYSDDEDGTNLYEFLSILFQTGATEATAYDYSSTTTTYSAVGDTSMVATSESVLTDEEKNVLTKYSGDENVGSAPYANDKNTLHPSYQIMPFIQGFEEYSSVYSQIQSVVDTYTDSIDTSMRLLSKRIDTYGNTINFWYSWNNDFTGYVTTREGITGLDSMYDYIDSPYNMDALEEFILYKDTFINNLLEKNNEYYVNYHSGSLFLDDNEIQLEVLRLNKYYDDIKHNYDRTIYKYFKDANGNIYILYKSSEERNKRNALGDVWVRLKNHPIAFPLFDVDTTTSDFVSESCVSSCDNQKLRAILCKIVSRFDTSYGKHNVDNSIADGDVSTTNFGIIVGTYTKTLPVLKSTESKTTSSDPTFDYTFNDFDITNGTKMPLVSTENSIFNNAVNSMLYKTVYAISDIPSLGGLKETFYYIDSVTNETLDSNDLSEYNVYKTIKGKQTEIEPNETGKLLNEPDRRRFYAEYDSDTNKLTIFNVNSSVNDELLFAEYTDEVVIDDGVEYYCKKKNELYSSNEVKHSCIKHKITISRLFKINTNALIGSVSEDGDISFDTISGDGYFCSSTEKTVESTSAISIVDGGIVSENFDIYSYYIRDVIGQQTTDVDKSDIVFLGGSNPYYVYYDANDELRLRRAFIKENQTSEFDAYDFSDNIYRTDVKSEFTSSLSVSDCIMKTSYYDKYSDTYGQFTLRSNPYQTYAVYTEVTGEPFEDKSKTDNSLPTGHVTIRDKRGKDHTFYYNLSVVDNDGNVDKFIRIKTLKYNQYTETLNITGSKFTGSISLEPVDNSKKSITLGFNDDTCDNAAIFSTLNNRYSQEKFFDMGISYNKKVVYLSYSDGRQDYSNGGVIYGKISSSYDNNNCNTLVLNTVNIHNVEYYNIESFYASKFNADGRSFHVGDCSTKSGCVSIFARPIYEVEKYNSEYELTKNTSTYKLIEYLNKSNIVDEIKNFIFDNMYDSLFIGLLISYFSGNAYDSIATRYFDNILFNKLVKFIDIDAVFKTILYNYVISASPLIELNFVIATADNIETTKININLKYGMFLFNEGSLFSANVNTTSDRIFVSLTTNAPIENEIFINVLGGETKFSNIKNNNTDCTITILSFEIGDTGVIYDETKTRYLMECSNIGYISQFYGIEGKNTVFSNKSLSSATEFAFELGCSPGTSGVQNDLFEELKCVLPDGYDFSSDAEIRKFVGLDTDTSDLTNNTGIVITSDGKDTYMLSINKTGGKLTPITDHDCLVYDVTRKHNGILFFAETEKPGSYVCAITEKGANCEFQKKKIPVVSEVDGFYNKSFKEFVDSENYVYALTQEGNALLRMHVDNVQFTPCDWINRIRFAYNEIVERYSDLDSITTKREGYIVCVNESNGDIPAKSCYVLKNGSWSLLELSAVDTKDISGIDSSSNEHKTFGYENSSLIGGKSTFALINEPNIMFFGAYSATGIIFTYSPTKKRRYSYKTIPFFVNNIPYVLEFGKIIVSDEIQSVVYNVKRVEKDGSLSQVVIEEDGEKKDHTVKFDVSDPIKGIVDTRVKISDNDDVKMIYTERGGVYKYSFGHNDLEFASTFNEVVKNIGSSDYNMDIEMYEGANHLLIRYTITNLKQSGLLWVRKNTPTSIATPATIKLNNNDVIGSIVVSNILTINDSDNSVMLMEDETGHIFKSYNDGETFIYIDTGFTDLHLIGCGYNSFYAENNGVKFRSADGLVWSNCGELAISDWVVFGVSGIDYCACSSIDTNYTSGIIDVSRRISIDRKVSLPESCDGILLYNDVLIAYSHSNGNEPFTVYRHKIGETEIETTMFSSIRSIPIGNAFAYNNDLFMTYESGDTVLIIDDLFDMNISPSVRTIDITDNFKGALNVYGKFNVVDGRLLLVPKRGQVVLEYDDDLDLFKNLYSFNSIAKFSDIDPINCYSNSEAVIITNTINSSGELLLYVSSFSKERDYGIVEIDNEFPIGVSYTKGTTKFRADGKTYDVYFITFVMINDCIRRSVTIMTKPNVDVSDIDAAQNVFERECSKSTIYSSGSSTIRYVFSSVDEKPRYKIRKMFSINNNSKDTLECLSISYSFQSEKDRNAVTFDYTLSGDEGQVSIYGGFDDKYKQYVEQLN